MGENALFGGVFAGLVYFAVGIRLIHLSWRSLRSPELILGLSLLMWSVSYAWWQVPIIAADRPLAQPLFFPARVFDHAGMLCFAYFVRVVFRKRDRWAGALVIAIAIAFACGIAGSIAMGDWEAMRPLENPWWWLGWGATFVPLIWITLEGFSGYSDLRRRVRLGLCDPIDCHRMLLWGALGVVWTAYTWSFAYQTLDVEANRQWSAALERAFSALDAAGVAIIWLVFFPPRFYRAWIGGSERFAPTREAR